MKAVLALVIIAFSTFSLPARRQHRLADDRLAWMFGLGAGVLGGAYGMNGPPLVVYGALRGWSPARFRATLQGYFLPASIVVMLGYWSVGLWTDEVSRYYLASLPAVPVAIVVGRIVNRRLSVSRFFFYIHAGLIAVGVALLAQAMRR